MSSSLLVNATFERDSCCVRAQYGLFSNGSVSVHNSAKIGSPQGADDEIYGWAQAEDASQPAKLTVHLQGVPYGAPCES
jgi:lipocalin